MSIDDDDNIILTEDQMEQLLGEIEEIKRLGHVPEDKRIDELLKEEEKAE